MISYHPGLSDKGASYGQKKNERKGIGGLNNGGLVIGMKTIEKDSTDADNLKKLFPQIAREWHATKNAGLTPEQVTPRSGKKVWWQCEQGHEWRTTVEKRAKGAACPLCTRKVR